MRCLTVWCPAAVAAGQQRVPSRVPSEVSALPLTLYAPGSGAGAAAQEDASEHIAAVLARVKPEYVVRARPALSPECRAPDVLSGRQPRVELCLLGAHLRLTHSTGPQHGRRLCHSLTAGAARAQRRAYKLAAWADATDFLTQLARASGKLGRGGEPDLNTTAKMVLHDWQRGKIPFFELPPGYTVDPPPAAPAEAVTVRVSVV